MKCSAIVLHRYDAMYDRVPGRSAAGDGGVGQRVHQLSLHNMSLDQANGDSVPM